MGKNEDGRFTLSSLRGKEGKDSAPKKERMEINFYGDPGETDASMLILYSKMKEVVHAFPREHGVISASYTPGYARFTLVGDELTREEFKKLLLELAERL